MRPSLLIVLLCSCGFAMAAESAKRESIPLSGFSAFWSRDQGAGRSAADSAVPREGKPSVRVEHTGDKDWSLTVKDRVKVAPGDILELVGWVKRTGEGDLSICAMAFGADGKVIDYTLGRRTAPVSDGWTLVRTRMVVPEKVREIQPRYIGHGPTQSWVDALALARVGNLAAMRAAQPGGAKVEGKFLAVAFDPASATMSVTDLRTRRTWTQRPVTPDLIVAKAATVAEGLDLEMYHAANDLTLTCAIRLDALRPELTVAISGQAAAPMTAPLNWPAPFVVDKNAYLVVPMNEGISYPVDDASIPPMRLVCYTGHGICMSFYGVTEGSAGQMTLIETPDDAQIQIARVDSALCIHPSWIGEIQKLGYERKLRFVFFDKGGHVAMAKRYRAYAKEIGLFKSLEDKRKEVPATDKLVGAVNIWYFDRNSAVAMAKDMLAAGIDRMLWSAANKPDALKALNEMPGVLTSRYDIYQDAMDPAQFSKLRYIHGDWTSDGWPKDMMVDSQARLIPGWKVEARDGTMIPCGVLCDRVAPEYAIKRIGEELKTHPYQCRFIDTTTASGWRECYSKDHPVTRRQSHEYKMKLLEVVSGKFKLVCGSETGQDAAVPTTHYFEGMLSLGPYRVPDSGRKMQVIWDEVPERVAKFQLGHAYRLPLWELVYHDCVVAQWYWGDYNNKLPALWDKRDQFNALYGTPGMFMFNRKYWDENKARFVRSYKTWGPVARSTGYSEMTDHRFLTADRAVQQTAFANGVIVTVNFGEKAFRLASGKEIAGGGVEVEGIR